MRKFWLCFGRADKWSSTLAYSMWGVKELGANGQETSPARDWKWVMPGDVVFFVTENIGVRGWGLVEKKTDSDMRFIWPDEVENKKVIYKRRIHIFIVAHDGERGREPIRGTSLYAQGGAGLSEVSQEEALKVFEQISKNWRRIDGIVWVGRFEHLYDRIKRSTWGKVMVIVFAIFGFIQMLQKVIEFFV